MSEEQTAVLEPVPAFREIAETFGTPSYVYDRADVRKARAQLLRALPSDIDLYYALKANPHPAIGQELAQLGCGTEVASAGEVEAGLTAGFPAARMLMTGPAKSGLDLDVALASGVRLFSVDSPADLARLGRTAASHGVQARCLLRVNADKPVPGMGLSMTGTPSQFGADASWVLSEPASFASAAGARVTGLHLYMGTNISDPDVLGRQFTTSLRLAGALRRALGPSLTYLDLGGGFGAPYARAGLRSSYDGLAGLLESLCDEELPGWRDGAVRLAFESGRYLVGGCGTLVTRVVDVKLSKGRTFVVLDAGINHLGGMAGLRRVPRIVPDLVSLDGQSRGLVENCAVVGPLCTPLDVWSQGVCLPALRPGDLVAVPNVGAYGLTASLLAFLGHRPPVEVVVDTSVGGAQWQASRLVLDRRPEGMSRERVVCRHPPQAPALPAARGVPVTERATA